MKQFSEEDFERILTQIYQASTDPDLLGSLLLQIGEPINATGGQLVTIEKDNPLATFDLFSGLDPSVRPHFEEYLENGMASRVEYNYTAPQGKVMTDYDHSSEQQINRDPFYQDFCRHYDSDYYGGLVLSQNSYRVTCIALLRAKKFGNLDQEEVHYLERIIPHLQRSLELTRKIRIKGALGGLFSTLDSLTGGVVVLDYRGQIAQMTVSARKILARQDGIFERDKQIYLADRFAQQQLTQEIRNCLKFRNKLQGKQGQYIRVECSTSIKPYIIHATPLRLEEDYFRDLSGLIYISDPHEQPPNIKEMVMQVYRLTPVEASLVEFLCDGHSLKEYAGQMNVSIEAPRFHLKNIFLKMNVSSQSELLAMVMKNIPSYRA